MAPRDFAAKSSFAELLQRLGSDFNLVQGVGGNASIKSKDRMIVKASGKRLGDASRSGFFHEVALAGDTAVDCLPSRGTRPSIETFLHALVPEKFVLHLHSTFGVALELLSRSNHDVARELESLGLCLIGYLRPGVDLGRGIKQRLPRCKDQDFLLANHGTLFRANSVSHLEDKVSIFEEFARSIFGPALASQLISPDWGMAPLTAGQRQKASWHADHNWRITPDHCVFLGSEPAPQVLNVLAGAKNADSVLGFEPPDSSSGYTARGEQLGWFFNVSQLLPFEKYAMLTEDEALFLGGWDLEQYRVGGDQT